MRRPAGAVVPATLAALAAGAGVAAQTSINGHASVAVGSPVYATAINHGSALVLALLVAVVTGAVPRALRRLRAGVVPLRRWWFLGGAMGYVAVLAIVIVTPEVGVVTVAVAITLGQLAGSVMADSWNLGPGGRRSLTPLRAAGLAVAVIAVLVGAFGRFDPANVAVVPVVVVAGIIVAIQQAANGWVVVATGEFAAMSVINFATSGVLAVIGLLIANAIDPIDFAAVPAWAPLGGAVGAVVGVVTAVTVRTIGVLSVIMCVAAGQAIASLALDLLIPVDAMGLTGASVVGAALAVAAVALAGLGAVSLPRRRGAADPGEAT
ncbi:DMT family transporter [Agromyces aerolatus]|uniref:DMT family transporter n=1 Tax=Agromyces sp. LY-1074 TaxID=3074080 RepID=UPI0028643E09|nr:MULTISPECIES: DMT family transporter [unclassified Agromyces]MDR5698680.1 DMT family transporter [Agromyces sp. LY-1074]MDR5704974.1 DMT family transporter [Agromyces sp. LY-1358]